MSESLEKRIDEVAMQMGILMRTIDSAMTEARHQKAECALNELFSVGLSNAKNLDSLRRLQLLMRIK